MNHPARPYDKLPVVYTSKAKCRDCYRCVRVCPVQAIRMKDGQAEVIPELCIACGTCIINCPQHAKAYRTDYGRVLQMMEDGEQLALSVAPSFVVYYDEWEQKRLPSAMRMLGFSYVAETAIGAWHTAKATLDVIESQENASHICTACPAVVSFVMHKTPQLAAKLVGVASPMIAHARMLKSILPQRKVVFVGPCVAKKDEAQWERNRPFVDAVLTFEELDELLRLKNITINQCEESNFNGQVPGDARLFPLEGGLLKTAGLKTDLLDDVLVAVSGSREVNASLEALQQNPEQKLWIEPLFCKNGCINGPFASKTNNSFIARSKVLAYNNLHPGISDEDLATFEAVGASFQPVKSKKNQNYSQQQIEEVLQKTGKFKREDELNCTACGYASCRDKAIAVLDGMAEPEMCVPYMRLMAEQKFDALIDHDPNGLLLLGSDLEILHMNPAFKTMFSCSDALLGKKVSYLIDPDPFEKLSTGKEQVLRQTAHYGSYNLICHLVAYSLPENNQYVGVFLDVTDNQSSKDKLTEIKTETVIKAQELIDHQIHMAQELAKFLGENTAMGEVLMKKLIDSIKK